MRRLGLTLLVAFTAISPVAGAEAPVQVRTSVSRTALWIGDHVAYSVELRCAPHVDLLLDDLLKERVRVEGGEIVSAETERTDMNGRITYRVRYTLVTYRVDVSAITIRPISVRYYARGRGQRPGDAAPAGEVAIPQRVLALRSTVPEADQAIALQPPGEVRLSPRYVALARPFGIALILIAVVPAGFLSFHVVRRLRDARTRYQARHSRKAKRGSFEQIRTLQPSTEADRRDAFGQLDQYVRDHLAVTGSVAAHTMTPSALGHAVQSWVPPGPHQAVEAVLAACEHARYAPDPSSHEDWEGAVRSAEEIVRHTRR